MGRKGAESNEERSGSGGRKPYAKYYNRKFIEQKILWKMHFLNLKRCNFIFIYLKRKIFYVKQLKYIRKRKKKSEEFQAVKTIIQTIERNGSVTNREKQKYKNIHLLKRGGFTKKFYEDTRI